MKYGPTKVEYSTLHGELFVNGNQTLEFCWLPFHRHLMEVVFFFSLKDTALAQAENVYRALLCSSLTLQCPFE